MGQIDLLPANFCFAASFPWPPSVLGGNRKTVSKGGRMAQAGAAKRQRQDAAFIARSWSDSNPVGWLKECDRLHIWICFRPPDRRRRDDDNLVRAFKSARDGIADGLGIDDRLLITHSMLGSVQRPGLVSVWITDRLHHPAPMLVFDC